MFQRMRMGIRVLRVEKRIWMPLFLNIPYSIRMRIRRDREKLDMLFRETLVELLALEKRQDMLVREKKDLLVRKKEDDL